jgi:hypothetical protein
MKMLALAIAATATFFTALVWSRRGPTAPIKDALGQIEFGSIASLERIELGGVDLGVLIRGVSVDVALGRLPASHRRSMQ